MTITQLQNLVIDQIAPAYGAIGSAVDKMMANGATIEDLRRLCQSAGLIREGTPKHQVEDAVLIMIIEALGGIIHDLDPKERIK